MIDNKIHAGTQSVDSGHVHEEAADWFVAYARPKLEAVAVHNLEAQGFEAYLPLYKRLKKVDGSAKVVFEPMFPRYVFFRPSHPGQSIASVSATRGMSHVIRFGTQIATIRPDILDAIRRFEADRNAMDVAEPAVLRPGNRVRFSDPAFQGLEGLVQSASSRRVSVLLELMGRPQLVSVESHRLEAV
ncbi:transcription/translation regulatory transformer protein RfaH [Comamonas humi]